VHCLYDLPTIPTLSTLPRGINAISFAVAICGRMCIKQVTQIISLESRESACCIHGYSVATRCLRTCDDAALWACGRVVPARVDTMVVEQIAAAFHTVSTEASRLGVQQTVVANPVHGTGVTHRVRILSTSGSDCY